ncbi:hypothetical protein CU098_007304 [Rhizopus stolonifer]|uniref:Nucleoporin Nup188 N-terminal subdomain III domain-containing protein n=1 Tax=Rhizopus stolonifer TaxID=4846 RepID=A0A367KR78_RHIST|nr:hypothetical protein CU098_007304 [Rhizopus stolonifer]
MQSNQNREFTGAYRRLFDTVERGTEQCSTDRLQTLVEEKKEQLKLGLEAFGEPSSQARQKFSTTSIVVDGKTIKLDQKEKDLVFKLSDMLHINELQCASLWDTFRQSSNDKDDYPLVENVPLILDFVSFYYEERLSLLQFISSLKRIALDKDHSYFSIADSILLESLSERFFSQYVKLLRTSAPKHLQQTSPQWPLIWVKQNLKEQKALLEIVFLCNLTQPFTPKFILSIIQEFEANNFGSLLTFGYLLDEEAHVIHREVINICIVLSINLIAPLTLSVGLKLNPEQENQTLLNTPDIITKINGIVSFMGESKEHAAFLLGWSFFLTCLDTALAEDATARPNYSKVVEMIEGKQTINSEILIDRPLVNGIQVYNPTSRKTCIQQSPHLDRILAGRSLKLNVFETLTGILESGICSEEDPNNHGYRNTLRVLLNSFLSVTRPNYIPMESYASLVNTYCLVYKSQPELCRLFWEQDFSKHNVFSLLATARGRFPVFFTDFIQLLSAVSGAPGEEAAKSDEGSALEVFNYLYMLPTMTVVLSSSIDVVAKDENGEVVIYAQQPIRVTPDLASMNSIVIPQGTRGLLVNTSETERVVRYSMSYSGWHIMASCLATFAAGNVDKSIDVEDESGSLKGMHHDAIHSILELLYNVLSSNTKLATTLVDHIDTVTGNPSDPTDTPLLISILCNIVTTCSAMVPCPTDILTTSIKCLTLLLPSYKSHIWQYLKYTPILPLMNTSVQLSSDISRSHAGSQIQQIVSKVEFTTGRYTLLLAFLDLVQGLVQDIQRSWWVTENTQDVNQQCQVQVLYVCLHYLMLDVLPTYALWRYRKLSERFLIGTKVLSILIQVVTHFRNPSDADVKLSFHGIREGIFTNFLYDGGIHHISPLIDTISEGARTANALYKSGYPKDAQRVEKLTEMTFSFVKILLQHRLEQINAGNAPPESTLEHLLLEHSTTGHSSDFLLRVARHIRYHHNIALGIEATHVLTLLCRTTAHWKSVPNLVQYLGSTEQVHAKDHTQNEKLSSSIWQFMNALMETQPSLAILFLDCGDFIMPSPKSAVRLLNGEIEPSKPQATAPITESAIRAATDILSHWETLSVEKPTITSNALRFLATFWQTAFDHYALVERSRADNALWDVLGKVLLNPNSDMDTVATNSLALVDAEVEIDHLDLNVRRRCCLNLSKAFAMRIIAYEIHITAGKTREACIEKLSAGLMSLLSKLSDPVKLNAMHEAFVKSDYDPSFVRQVEFSADNLLETLNIQDRSVLLFKMAHISSGDDVAQGEARQYGNAYLYDYYLASARVQSLYKQVANKHDYSQDIAAHPSKAVLELKDYANQFLRNLLLVNHNSSIVDSQIILLKSFKSFIETCSRRSSDLIWSSKQGGADVLYAFIKDLIQTAQNESRDDGVTLTSYSVWIQFIRNLTEDWIAKNSPIVLGQDNVAKKEYASKSFTLLSALCGLLNRENYALFQSICDLTAIRFHRPLLETIMLSLRTLRGTIEHLVDPLSPMRVDIQTSLADLLTTVCSSFHVLTIKASSYSAEGAHVSEEVQENCIKDITVVVSLLIELIRPKYKIPENVWLDTFNKHQTTASALAFFNAGIRLVVNEVDRQSSNTSGVYSISITPYAETALYFLLALSNIPKAAEQLVKENLFSSLCNNSLTPRLQRGTLDLFIRFGDGSNTSPAFVERNPLHFNWCQMLGVVSNLMRTMGKSETVLQNTVNLIQMYGPQIGTAYNNANGAKDSIFGFTPSESLSTPLLEEMERINTIFFGLSKCLERLPNIADNLFISFKDCSLHLLQRYHYFYTHPSHMQAQLYPVDNIERQQAQTVPPKSSVLMNKIIKTTLTISHTMLSSLIALTQADIIMTTSDVQWPFGNTIINPDSRVITGEIASFGTLMEYINVCLVMMNQWQEEDKASIGEFIHVIQDCALVLTTQVALWVAKPDISEEMRLEIAQPMITDIAETLNKISTSFAKQQKPLGLIHFLQAFLANRFFEK